MTEKKKKDGKKEEEAPSAPVEQLILERKDDKYSLVPLASIWARELKKQQEFQGLSTAQLLEAALKDVLTGKVTWELVDKLPKESEGEKSKK